MYTVNHNGTEDWADPPEGTVRRDDGRVEFPTLDAATEFGAEVARSAIKFFMHDLRKSYAAARDSLRDTDEGVPVQIIDSDSGAVVGVVDPDTIAPHYPEGGD